MIPAAVEQVISKAKNYPYIIRVGVFGSCARNDENSTSDIDILIDYDNSNDDFLDDLDDFMEQLEGVSPLRLDYTTVTGLMNSKNQAFINNVMNDVKWLYVSSKSMR